MTASAIQSVLSLLILTGIGYFIAGRSWYPSGGTDFLSRLAYAASPAYGLGPAAAASPACGSGPAAAASPACGSGPAADASQAYTASLKADDCPAAAGPAAASVLSAALEPLPALALPSASGRAAIMDALRSIVSPPLVGFLLGVVLVVANLKLPDFIFSPVSSLRLMTTPLAMIFIGAVIRGTNRKQARVSCDLAMVMAVRFLVTPVVMILMLRSLPIGTQMKQVFFLMSTMPVMTQLGIMARESGSDCEYASVLVTVTTAFSLLAIPAYIYLLDRFHVF